MRPSDGRYSLWPVGVTLFVLLTAVVSVQPTVKLNSSPPADFIALRASVTQSKTTTAEAYWNVASSVIQWKYSRTAELPEQLPAEFKLPEETSKSGSGEDRAIRAAYWAKLREEWIRPDNWHTAYSFSLTWVFRDLESLRRGFMSLIDHN